MAAEHELPDDGRRILSIVRSSDLPIKPWDALGMLSFATIEQGAVYQGEDDDSE